MTSSDPLSRDARRSMRMRATRARTLSVVRMAKRELVLGSIVYPERDYWRPTRRIDCERVARPCPFVACRYHLYLDVSPRTGSIKLNFPDLEPDEMVWSCALDVADSGETTLHEVGMMLNITQERVRQIERVALRKLGAAQGLRDFLRELDAPECADQIDRDEDGLDALDSWAIPDMWGVEVAAE